MNGLAKWIRSLSILLIVVFIAVPSWAGSGSWQQVAQDIETILNQAVAAYQEGRPAEAKELVSQAYFGPFEEKGMETAVRLNISARRAFEVEYGFTEIKQLIDAGAPVAEVKAAAALVIAMVYEDAGKLGGSERTALGTFIYSLMIIVREGFEAILIIGAIIAYLVKSGNGDKVKTIYHSCVAAIAASVITAVAIRLVFRISGASQEILEGVTMLIAVAVLFSVSFWLISKVEAKKWQEYIEGKVQTSLTIGSKFALWSAAFLAVYREGAETVLFYQALLSGEDAVNLNMVVLGFVVGCLGLVALYKIVRYGTVKIPLKPFFITTSTLMYYLAFVFAGDGIKELQEGGLVGITPIPGMKAIGFLGIYPTWQSVFLQLLLLLVAVVAVVYHFVWKRSTAGTGRNHQAT